MEVFKMIIPIFNFENMSVFNKEYIFSNKGWPSKDDAMRVISEDNTDRNGFPLTGDEGKEGSKFIKSSAIRLIEELAAHEWPNDGEGEKNKKGRKILLNDGSEVNAVESVLLGNIVYEEGFGPQLFYMSRFELERKN